MTGRPREWDYGEVARAWHLAVDRGENPIEAVAALKGRTAEAATYAINRARKAGLIPPSGRERPRKPRPKIATGKCPTCGTVITPTFAPRQRQIVDETKPPVPPADRRPGASDAAQTARRALFCDDCEFMCELDRPRLLFRHCLEVHGRRPTLDERRPARLAIPAPTR